MQCSNKDYSVSIKPAMTTIPYLSEMYSIKKATLEEFNIVGRDLDLMK